MYFNNIRLKLNNKCHPLQNRSILTFLYITMDIKFMFLLRGHWFIKRAISSLMKYQCSAQQVNNLTRLMVIAHVQKFCWFHKPALLAASGNSWVLGAKSGEQQHATFRRHGARGCTGSLEPAFLPPGGSCNGVQRYQRGALWQTRPP